MYAKKISLLLLIFFTHCSLREIKTRAHATPAASIPSEILFFDTSFLAQYDAVAEILIAQEQFQEVTFATSDAITLHGLWRALPNASYTIILCAGFYPGRKEALATFTKILPVDANILLFDARGHGKSGGRFFSNLVNYGIDEYKDVIAALEFVHTHTNTSLFIHGICAGAFHAAHALIKLGPEKIAHYDIKGLIFDSGIVSISDTMHIPEIHVSQKLVPHLLLPWFPQDTKQTIKERWLCKVLATLSQYSVRIIRYCMAPFVHKNRDKTIISTSIGTISCPVLFIHARNDTYAPFEHICALAEKVSNKENWWIDESEHALHHLKHTKEYAQHVNAFIEQKIKR